MKIAVKAFVYEDGVPVGVKWTWNDAPEAVDRTVTTIRFDALNGMEPWFLANGISQKLGDAYSGAGGVEEAKRMFDAVWDQVVNEKAWRGGGGGISILAEATWRVMEDNPAVEAPPLEDIAKKIKAMDAKAIKAMKKKWPSIDREVKKIQLERAEAKVKQAEATEGGNDEDLSDLFTG